jgi:hypothetical protein
LGFQITLSYNIWPIFLTRKNTDAAWFWSYSRFYCIQCCIQYQLFGKLKKNLDKELKLLLK